MFLYYQVAAERVSASLMSGFKYPEILNFGLSNRRYCLDQVSYID